MGKKSRIDSDIEEEIEEEIDDADDDEIEEEIEEEVEEESESQKSEDSESESSASESQSDTDSESDSESSSSDSSSPSSSEESESSSSSSSDQSSIIETPEKKEEHNISYHDDFDIEENDWELEVTESTNTPMKPVTAESTEKNLVDKHVVPTHNVTSQQEILTKTTEQSLPEKPNPVTTNWVDRKQPILPEVPQTHDRELEDIDMEEVGVIFDSGSVSYLDPEHPSLEYSQMKTKSRATFYQPRSQSRIDYYTPAKYNYHIQQISSSLTAIKTQRRTNDQYEQTMSKYPSLSMIKAEEVGHFVPSQSSSMQSPQRVTAWSKQAQAFVGAMEEYLVEKIAQKMLDLSVSNQVPSNPAQDKFQGLLQHLGQTPLPEDTSQFTTKYHLFPD